MRHEGINVPQTLNFDYFNSFLTKPRSIMKIRNLSLIASMLLFFTPLFSQEYTFRVLVSKGANEYRSEGAQWQALKTGTSLKATDEIRLADNAYVGLVHHDGKPIEIKKAGSYKVSPDLTSQVAGGSTLLKKYVDFAFSSNTAEAKKNRLNATGAVQRTVEGSGIRLTLPPNHNSGIYNNIAVINWDGSQVKGPYGVTLRNMFDDVLSRIETPETTLTLNLEEGALAKENAILVEVAAKNDPSLISDQHLIKRLAPAQQDSVKKELDDILAVMDEESALNHLILAGFYEEHQLIIDAIASYENAVRLAPGVDAIKDAYNEFLMRNALAY